MKEDIKKPPARKGKKKGERIPLNPEAFAKMSVGIEKLTLQVHKDKELKDTEQQFIETSKHLSYYFKDSNNDLDLELILSILYLNSWKHHGSTVLDDNNDLWHFIQFRQLGSG